MDCEQDCQVDESIRTIALLDGDIGTQLIFPRKPVQRYRKNRSDPDAVYNIHMEFLQAGANIIRTNTTDAFVPHLSRNLYTSVESSIELIERGVEIAKNVVGYYNQQSDVFLDKAKVVGTCGRYPSTRYIPYDMKNVYREHMQTLLNSGVDTLSLEGIRTVENVEMFIELLREFPNANAFIMCSTKNANTFINISEIVDTVFSYNSSSLLAFGINGVSPDRATILLNKLKKKYKWINEIPIVVCSSKNPGEEVWNPINIPAVEWTQMGIYYIGGDRGVVAEDIKSIRDEWNHILRINI